MTAPENERENAELERLVAAYRKLPAEEPSPELDRAVLAHARAALGGSAAARAPVTRAQPRWPALLATAATLTLAVGLTWQLRDTTQREAPPLMTLPQAPVPGAASEPAVVVDTERTAETTVGGEGADRSLSAPATTGSKTVDDEVAAEKRKAAPEQDAPSAFRVEPPPPAAPAPAAAPAAQAPPPAVAPKPAVVAEDAADAKKRDADDGYADRAGTVATTRDSAAPQEDAAAGARAEALEAAESRRDQTLDARLQQAPAREPVSEPEPTFVPDVVEEQSETVVEEKRETVVESTPVLREEPAPRTVTEAEMETAPAPVDAAPPVATTAAPPPVEPKTIEGNAAADKQASGTAQPAEPPASRAPLGVTTGPSQRGRVERGDRRDAADWLAAIRRLVEAGRNEEARSELAAFERTYPGYRVPDDLRAAVR